MVSSAHPDPNWSERVTNFEVRRRRATGQPLLSDRLCYSADQTPQVVWPCMLALKIILVLYKPIHIVRFKELEAASRSSKTYLAKDGGGRSAPI